MHRRLNLAALVLDDWLQFMIAFRSKTVNLHGLSFELGRRDLFQALTAILLSEEGHILEFSKGSLARVLLEVKVVVGRRRSVWRVDLVYPES